MAALVSPDLERGSGEPEPSRIDGWVNRPGEYGSRGAVQPGRVEGAIKQRERERERERGMLLLGRFAFYRLLLCNQSALPPSQAVTLSETHTHSHAQMYPQTDTLTITKSTVINHKKNECPC